MMPICDGVPVGFQSEHTHTPAHTLHNDFLHTHADLNGDFFRYAHSEFSMGFTDAHLQIMNTIFSCVFVLCNLHKEYGEYIHLHCINSCVFNEDVVN